MQLIVAMGELYELTFLSPEDDCIEQASSDLPDVLLLDDMVTEPNCYEVCKTLKANPLTEKILIILISDLSSTELDEEVSLMGADGYVCRPIDHTPLINEIDTLLSFAVPMYAS
jgi:PleD family two-component response regulator